MKTCSSTGKNQKQICQKKQTAFICTTLALALVNCTIGPSSDTTWLPTWIKGILPVDTNIKRLGIKIITFNSTQKANLQQSNFQMHLHESWKQTQHFILQWSKTKISNKILAKNVQTSLQCTVVYTVLMSSMSVEIRHPEFVSEAACVLTRR